MGMNINIQFIKRLLNFLHENKGLAILFGLSILIRIGIALNQISFWLINIPPWNFLIPETLEPYLDYVNYYRKFAEEFIFHGWFPYISRVSDPILDSYLYPPLFLYVISIPALFSIDLVFLPLLLADITLPFIIYQILKKSSSQKTAKWGFLAVALCPISIFYSGGFLFNISLVTLFFIISLYFIHNKQFKWGIFMLGLAFLLKQIILFFILPILFYVILKSVENNTKVTFYIKQALIYGGILVGTLFIGSLPWILIAPNNYLSTIFMGQGATLEPEFRFPQVTYPITWYSFLITWGAPFWSLYICGFLNFTLLGIICIEILSLCLIFYWHKKRTLTWMKFLDVLIYTVILVHLFLPRGVYKYYFTFIVPLAALWICFHFEKNFETSSSQYRNSLILFLLISLSILFIPRLYYLPVVWVIFILMLQWNLKNPLQIKVDLIQNENSRKNPRNSHP